MRRRTAQEPLEWLRLLPAGGVLALWTAMMFWSGGYRPATWLPAGLLLLGLLVVAAIGARRILPSDDRARRALCVLAAFTAWCFASITWSDAPGLAWEASNLLLVGLLGTWTLALAPWRARSAGNLMLAFSVGAAIVCLWSVLDSLTAADLTSSFEDYRFSPPLDYPNTTAAFAVMAALPVLVFAAGSRASVPVRALAQGLAGFLCAFALLPQSRGILLGGAAALVVLLLAVPFRRRMAAHAGLVVMTSALTAGPAADLYAAASTGRASSALGDALTAVVLATAGNVVGGFALALAADRLAPGDRVRRLARLAALAVAVVVVVAGVGVGVARSAAIADLVGDHWSALTHPGEKFTGGQAGAGGANRLVSTDPKERYDYLRVALDGFRADPIGGMGAGGFEHRYALDRRFRTPSRYPHNLAMKVVGDTGVVGVGLIVAFVWLVAAGLLRGARGQRPPERMVAATGAGVFAYFLAHGMFDWLEAYPVLLGPALAFPLVALAVRGRGEHRPETEAEPAPEGDARQRWALAGGVAAYAAVVAVVASLVLPWLALRYRDRAAETWRSNPEMAYQDLNRAARLDPLSDQALVDKGAIAIIRSDLTGAETAFSSALDRQQSWLPHFGLALVADQSGDRARTERELAAALRQHPKDRVLPVVAAAVRRAGAVDPATALRDALQAPQGEVERIR